MSAGLDREEEPMKASVSEGSDTTAGSGGSRSWAIVLAVAICSLGLYAIVSGPAEFRASERARAEQIALEDREFCARFRMPPGSEGFATCAADLTELRRRHRGRVIAEASGMF